MTTYFCVFSGPPENKIVLQVASSKKRAENFAKRTPLETSIKEITIEEFRKMFLVT